MIRTLRRLWSQALGSVRLRHRDEDLAAELDTHIQLLADDHVRRGLSAEEAYRRARLEFGSVEATKERYRDARGLPLVDLLVQDLRYACRGIRRDRGFASIAILSLAIGIGANTAIFSLVNGVLLQPLAYAEPERVFSAGEVFARVSANPNYVNPMHALAWAAECPSLEQVSLVRGGRAQLTGAGEPLSVPAAEVSSNLFTLLGVQPVLGRAFAADEERDGNQHVAIVSESLWRARFDADPSLVGKSIDLDGEPHQVVGIAPAWLRLPFSATVSHQIFRPLVLSAAERTRLMGNFNYAALVRVRRGATTERALAEMNVVQDRFPRLAGRDVFLKAALTPVHELVTGRARLGLWTLAAAVGTVLLIVCVNLANLFLSRIASRAREAAIRAALGASRIRQFTQVLTESLVLAVAGGLFGVLLASVILRLLVATTTVAIPRLDEVRLDGTVLAFAFALTVLAGLLFGALPAWRLTRQDPQQALRAGSRTATEGRSSKRLRQTLIGVEVGLSAALLIVAALLTSSLSRLLRVDKGFDVEHVFTADIALAGSRYAEDIDRGRFFDRFLAAASGIPGVQAAGIVTQLPTQGESWNDPIYLEGGTRYTVNNRYASPGYFSAMNIAIRRGRGFDDRDRGRGVAVLSEKAVKLLWPGVADPIGRSFMGEDDKIKTLVGIVSEVRASLPKDAPPTAYYPYWQRVPDTASFVVRATTDAATIAGGLRVALRSEDSQLPVPPIRTMADVMGDSVAQRRFQSTLMVAFAASALLMASLGIYGVVAYSVARRRNEIGIRMALGARRSQLLALVIRQGMAPVVLGLGAGLFGAVVLGRTISGLLFGIQPADPLTIAGVTAVLLLVGLLACLVPARRATNADAIAALRLE